MMIARTVTLSIGVAFLSLLAGILTPPLLLLSRQQEEERWKDDSDHSSSQQQQQRQQKQSNRVNKNDEILASSKPVMAVKVPPLGEKEELTTRITDPFRKGHEKKEPPLSNQEARRFAEEEAAGHPRSERADDMKRDIKRDDNKQQGEQQPSLHLKGCTYGEVSQYLHHYPVPGYHVVCVETTTAAEGSGGAVGAGDLWLQLFRGGARYTNVRDEVLKKPITNVTRHLVAASEAASAALAAEEEPTTSTSDADSSASSAVTAVSPAVVSWESLKLALQEEFNLPDDDGSRKTQRGRQPWAIYSTQGERLVAADGQNVRVSELLQKSVVPNRNDDNDNAQELPSSSSSHRHHHTMLVFEGGQFLWPGVRIGFRRNVALHTLLRDGQFDRGTITTSTNDTTENNNGAAPVGSTRTVTLETLALVPLVFGVDGFLSAEECGHIQEKATPTLRYSDVVLMDKDKGRPATDFRTSQTTFLHATSDPILTAIDYRTASLVRVPRQHQEPVQVLRYGHTEKYDAHLDAFEPTLYKGDERTMSLTKNGMRNRLATVFWYLSTVERGGETVFPRTGGRQELSMQDCSAGLKVKPVRGKVIIFYSMTADGKLDKHSLHGACPVEEGIKWAANKWVWNEPMSYVPA